MQFKNIYFIGDMHSAFRGIKSYINNYNIENSLFVCVGDIKIHKLPDSQITNLNSFFNSSNNTFFSIRGNHDNPIYFDGKHDLSNIKLIPDYTYITINNLSFCFIGGAISIDRLDSKDIVYKNEECVFKPELLKKSDVLVTHSAPDFCEPVFSEENLINSIWEASFNSTKEEKDRLFNLICRERNILERIYTKVNPTHYYYGHFHTSFTLKDTHNTITALDVNEIVKFL